MLKPAIVATLIGALGTRTLAAHYKSSGRTLVPRSPTARHRASAAGTIVAAALLLGACAATQDAVDWVNTEISQVAFHNRGIEYHKKGLYDRAIAEYNQAIKLNPDYTRAFNNRGRAYAKKGLYDRAIADFDAAIKLKPDYTSTFNSRGRAYVKKGLYDRAIADFDAVIKLKPDYAFAFTNRGRAYAKKGLYDRAEADFNRARELKAGKIKY